MSMRLWRPGVPGVIAVLAVAAVAGYGASSSGTTRRPMAHTASGTTTIQFAESGLGTEGQQTQAAINAFEKANPSIKVKIDVLSPNSTTYLQQLQQRFIAGSGTPDVLESDVTYPAKFAQAGWIKSLKSLHPNMKQFFSTEVAAGTYNGATYAIPWFDNPEGLFYRTDLIKKPPTSPAQIVSDAQAAMKKDKSLKEGLAFEGEKYEGAITAFMTVDGAFGGHLTANSVDTSANVAALKWLHDAIYVNKIAPQAVTGWQEGNVQQEFTAGHAAFAINYPFVASVDASTKSSPAYKHTGYIPFPAAKGGRPGSALGGEMLAINAKSANVAADWKLIQYLTSPSVETKRAIATGDPPSLPSAYTSSLYAKAPYFKEVKVLNGYAQPRPVSPKYLQISVDLQNAFSAVFANTSSPASAMKSAASAIHSANG
jgi:multiple sugar transport system substrate-binding protein